MIIDRDREDAQRLTSELERIELERADYLIPETARARVCEATERENDKFDYAVGYHPIERRFGALTRPPPPRW